MIQFTNAINYYKKLILSELKDNDIDCFIAGGCLRDYFSGLKTTNDIDIFFSDKSQYDKAFKYLNEKENSEILFQNHNGTKIQYGNLKLDIVCSKFFNSPQTAIDNFDFTSCSIALNTNKVYHHETTFIDIAKKQLMINKISFPKSTLERAIKYSRKDYFICRGELSKIIEALYKEYEEIKDKHETDKNIIELVLKSTTDNIENNNEDNKTSGGFNGFD